MAETRVKLGSGGFSLGDKSSAVDAYFSEFLENDIDMAEWRDIPGDYTASTEAQISRMNNPTATGSDVGPEKDNKNIYMDEFFNNSPFVRRYEDDGSASYEDGIQTISDSRRKSMSVPEASLLEFWAGEMRTLSEKDMSGTISDREREMLVAYQDYFTGRTGMADGGVVQPLYMQEGGTPMDAYRASIEKMLADTAPGGQSPRPVFADLRGPVGDDPPVMSKEALAEFEDQKGIGSVIFDRIVGRDVTSGVQKSGRVGGDSPEFMETLMDEYGYPSVFDETGRNIIPTDPEEYPEDLRHARPEGREDMPTYPELEDARSHMLASAKLAAEYGPETAETTGDFGEWMDRFLPVFGGQNDRDVVMDKRNNAVGRQIFIKAGIDAPVERLTEMVDAEIFKQLDRIMGRSEEDRMTPALDQPLASRNFKSPSEGPDVFFPRNKEGFFDTTME